MPFPSRPVVRSAASGLLLGATMLSTAGPAGAYFPDEGHADLRIQPPVEEPTSDRETPKRTRKPTREPAQRPAQKPTLRKAHKQVQPTHKPTHKQAQKPTRKPKVIHYTVRRGDTVTELATRFHAWTAEVIEVNHLGPDAALTVGDRLLIPLAHTGERDDRSGARSRRSTGDDRWRESARQRVRRMIVKVSKGHGVDPQLALAVSWQESGWAMRHVSHAGAIGAMQVLPDTGQWMSRYAGHRLRLHRLRDNVTAGVLLLRTLRQMTTSYERMIAGYYQGVGSIRDHGFYADTRMYVDNVMAIRARLEKGKPPVS